MKPCWEQAARDGDAESLSAQLSAGADVNGLDRYGQSALMLSCLAGSLEAVSVLVRAGANLDITAKYCLSAAMLAAVNGHEEIVRFLHSAGADFSLRGCGAPGFHEKTVADLARASGLEDLARDLSS
ncbi:ankyrin repeat domain-containing protein [Oceanisphaera arctica]|uniref:Uncharacterized protein n=1 Tax=Oceanisphaera arctica TaxID=641510 RepID=A0A2P5TQV6_9GAMM|nr:ankyrin repeat domain-containing protein [Oceanisphaera arctica]PPL18171.1 hypothetical protein UN63_01265 [Oceanisphaera arctica]GHA21898.1 hypothetical protein GCM10007082_23380 [Oceanisphaera arctica]